MDLSYIDSDWTFDFSLFFSQTWTWPSDGTLFGRYLACMLPSPGWCSNVQSIISGCTRHHVAPRTRNKDRDVLKYCITHSHAIESGDEREELGRYTVKKSHSLRTTMQTACREDATKYLGGAEMVSLCISNAEES